MFIEFVHKETGYITHEDNNLANILGENIMENSSIITIDGAILVIWLKNNLLSISESYDKGYTITFNTLNCLIEHKAHKERVFKG